MEIKNWYGLARLIFSLPFLLLQLLTLPLFLIYIDYRQRNCYRIMFSLSVSDCLQLLSHSVMLLLRLFRINNPLWIERFCGGIVTISSDQMYFLSFLLALERLIIVTRARFLTSLSDVEPCWEVLLFNSMLLLSWLATFAGVAMFMTPFLHMEFNDESYTFRYGNSSTSSYKYMQTFRSAEMYFNLLIMVPLPFLFYLIIIVLLITHRRGSMLAHDQGLLVPREKRVLLLAFAQFIMLTIPYIVAIVGQPPGATMQISQEQAVQFERNFHFQWILINGMNPVLLLATNIEFRQRFLQIYRLKKAFNNVIHIGQSSQVVPSSTQNLHGYNPR